MAKTLTHPLIKRWTNQRAVLSESAWCALVAQDLLNHSGEDPDGHLGQALSTLSTAQWHGVWTALPADTLSWVVCAAHVDHLLRATDPTATQALMATKPAQGLIAVGYALQKTPAASSLVAPLLSAVSATPHASRNMSIAFRTLAENGFHVPSMHDPLVLTPIWRALDAADQHRALLLATGYASWWLASVVPEVPYPKGDARWTELFERTRASGGSSVMEAIGPRLSSEAIIDILEDCYSRGGNDHITNIGTTRLALSWYDPSQDSAQRVPCAMSKCFHINELSALLKTFPSINGSRPIMRAFDTWFNNLRNFDDRDVPKVVMLARLAGTQTSPDDVMLCLEHLLSAPSAADQSNARRKKAALAVELVLEHASEECRRRAIDLPNFWVDTPTINAMRDRLRLTDVVSSDHAARKSVRM